MELCLAAHKQRRNDIYSPCVYKYGPPHKNLLYVLKLNVRTTGAYLYVGNCDQVSLTFTLTTVFFCGSQKQGHKHAPSASSTPEIPFPQLQQGSGLALQTLMAYLYSLCSTAHDVVQRVVFNITNKILCHYYFYYIKKYR